MTALLNTPDSGKLRPAWARIDQHLKWWHKHDPTNTWGRYAVDKDGRAMPYEGSVDATHPFKIARAVFACWYSLDAWLDAMEENYADMMNEMRGQGD